MLLSVIRVSMEEKRSTRRRIHSPLFILPQKNKWPAW
jgi:hypothetical protein